MYSPTSDETRSATMFGTPMPYVPPPAPPKNANAQQHRSRSSSLIPFSNESKLVGVRYDQTVQAEPPIPIPPPRSSRRPPPRPISTNTTRAPVVVAPPRPAPPTEQHPALRTISSPRISQDKDIGKRDSAHASTVPSSPWTIREDSETDDEDPFAYENVQNLKFPEIKPLHLITRSASPSLYSHKEGRVSESNSRASAPSPALSDGETVSPVSPVTPPANFSKRFARSFSLRSNSSKSSSSKMKRLRKKSANNDGVPCAAYPGYPLGVQDGSAPKSPNSPNGRFSPALDPHGSPVISTCIPTESLLEDDFMTQLSFSKRGSLIFGAKHTRKSSRNLTIMADPDSSSSGNENIGPAPSREPRSFPLVPAHDKGINAVSGASAKDSVKVSGVPDNAKIDALTNTPPTPRRLPPSVRVISAEAEKESQKVRSLYESGEGLNWEDGARHSSIDERLQPAAECPSKEDENDAYGFLIDPISLPLIMLTSRIFL